MKKLSSSSNWCLMQDQNKNVKDNSKQLDNLKYFCNLA